MNLLSAHALGNARHTRSVLSWIAVGAVAFGVWFAPACASICSNMTAAVSGTGPDHCQGMGPKAAGKSADSQALPCQRLQAGMQTNVEPEPVSPSSVALHAPDSADHGSPLENPSRRPP